MTTLYEKRGRRYHVWGDEQEWHHGDVMRVGEARLVVCTEPGAYRYIYGVQPDMAGFAAAAQVATHAMVQAITEKAKASPQLGEIRYTDKQREVIERCRQEMADEGVLMPLYWTNSSPHEIAQAGIDAVVKLAKDSEGDPKDGLGGRLARED